MRTTAQRGYGAAHQRERAKWKPLVEAGEVNCHATICFMPTRWIQPGTPWDLGHNTERTTWTGPEHRYCNRKEPQLRTRPTPAPPARRWVI